MKDILMGIITAPFGIKGLVRVKSFCANPTNIENYPLFDEAKNKYKIFIKSTTKGVLVVHIKGINTRELAENLRNVKLYTKAENIKIMDNEFLIEDLIGLNILQNGKIIDKVKFVHNFGAGDIIESENGEMLAFTIATFPNINIEKEFIEYSPLEIVNEKED